MNLPALRIGSRASVFPFLLMGILCGPSVRPAEAQLSRGLERFNWRTHGAYEFGFQPLYEIVVFNDTDETAFFELASYVDVLKRTQRPSNSWEASADELGLPGMQARRANGGFRTAAGVRVLVEPRMITLRGRDIALYHLRPQDVAQASRRRKDEQQRVDRFREAIESNVKQAAGDAVAANSEGAEGDPGVMPEQSAYHLEPNRPLATAVRDWLWARERID